MSSLVWESRLPVGSSARMSAGSPTNARAIATRWRWPPDNLGGRVLPRSASPTSSRASWARCSRVDRSTPRYNSPFATLSTTRAPSRRWKLWKMKPSRLDRSPLRWRSPSVAVSIPSMSTSPLVGRSSVPMMLSNVDLPLPDGPTIANISPRSMRRSTPSSARIGGSPG